MIDTIIINSPQIKRDSQIIHTPSRKNTKIHVQELFLFNTLKNRTFEYLNIDQQFLKNNKKQCFISEFKLKKFDSTSTVLSLNSKSKGNTEDFLISPIYKENKSINCLITNEKKVFSIKNEEENDIKFLNSPESEKSEKKFDFSLKNYLPRKRTCDVEKKSLNIENYFNNNYLPSDMNIEESEISQNYLSKMKRQSSLSKNDNSQNLGPNSSYKANKLVTINNNININFNNFHMNYSLPNKSNNNEIFQKFAGNHTDPKPENNNLNLGHIIVSNFNDNTITPLEPAKKRVNNCLPISKNDDNLTKCNNQFLHRKNSTGEETNREKKNNFVERQGDWICVRCKNLNFSFRVVCNRCKIPKNELQGFYEEYVKNLNNIVQYNEMLQIKANQSCPNNILNTLPNYVQNSNVNNYLFNSNLFSLNTSNFNNKCKVAGAMTKEVINPK
jgi:hypothetical protein